MLNKINQKNKHCMISLIYGLKKSQTHRSRVQWWLSKTGGRKKKWRNIVSKGPKFQLSRMNKF